MLEVVLLTSRLEMGQTVKTFFSSPNKNTQIHSVPLILCQLCWEETNPLQYFWDNLFHLTLKNPEDWIVEGQVFFILKGEKKVEQEKEPDN